MKKKEEKQEFEDLKKTAAAHGTVSEVVAEEKAKSSEVVTEDLIVKEEVKEETVRERRAKYVKGDKKSWKREGDEISREQKAKLTAVSTWEPKTKLGQEVKDGKIKSIDEILDSDRKILEEQIVDFLLNLKADLISIGQAKGKFGGGKIRAWRQTQKKTKEGNIAVFSTMAVV